MVGPESDPWASDLVQDSRLDVAICADCTVHTTYLSNPESGQRRVRVEDRWQRSREIGRGAFGDVFLARCISGPSKGQARAVKEIRKGDGLWPTTTLHRELEAVAKFSHSKYQDHFVKSFGWYEDDRVLCITMEYLPHGDLEKYLHVPLPEVHASSITEQVLEGLIFMHQHRFVHRDLKPSNLLVLHSSPNWWIKIADFGVSKRAESNSLKTRVGTDGYMAPEVYGLYPPEHSMISSPGATTSFSSAVDIWAVGAIAFRMVTGQLPFQELAHLGEYVYGTASLEQGDMTALFTSFATQAMARSPFQRPSAPDAIRDAWITGTKSVPSSPAPDSVGGPNLGFPTIPTTSQLTPTGGQTWRPTGVATKQLELVEVSGRWSSQAGTTSTIETRKPTLLSHRHSASTKKRNTSKTEYSNRAVPDDDAQETGVSGFRTQPLRDIWQQFLNTPGSDRAPRRKLTLSGELSGRRGGILTQLELSPDGKWLAGLEYRMSVDAFLTIWKCNLGQPPSFEATQTILLPHETVRRGAGILFSPDSKALVYRVKHTFLGFLLDSETQLFTRASSSSDQVVAASDNTEHILFSRDRRWELDLGPNLFASKGDRGDAFVWRISWETGSRSKQALLNFPSSPIRVYTAQISPTQRWLALGTEHGVDMWKLNIIAGGRQEFVHCFEFGAIISGLDFSPDGNLLAVAGHRRAKNGVQNFLGICSVDKESGKLELTYAVHGDSKEISTHRSAPAFSPDGRQLAVTVDNKDIDERTRAELFDTIKWQSLIWDVDQRAGKLQPSYLLDAVDLVWLPAPLPDGQQLAVSRAVNAFEIWEESDSGQTF